MSSEPLDPLELFGPDQKCFGCGPNNDVGLKMRFAREGDEIVTRFTPRIGYEGVPGVMHGGLCATVADELAVWTMVGLRGRMAFTTSMQTRFLRPLRIGVEAIARGKIASETEGAATVSVSIEQAGEATLAGRIGLLVPTVEAAEKMMGRPLPEAWRRFVRE